MLGGIVGVGKVFKTTNSISIKPYFKDNQFAQKPNSVTAKLLKDKKFPFKKQAVQKGATDYKVLGKQMT